MSWDDQAAWGAPRPGNEREGQDGTRPASGRGALREPLRERLLRPLRAHGLPGRRRVAVVRRATAVTLLCLAGALLLRPESGSAPPTAPVLVAARDLPPGRTLGAEDVRLVETSPTLRPSGALRRTATASGRVLAGAAGAGEPITQARLVGPDNTALTTGTPADDTAAVPVRLTDAAIAGLLRPGVNVDVVTTDQQEAGHRVLAENATVITVLEREASATGIADSGQLVIIALPADAATRVAAVSLGQPVTVTLR